MDELPPERLATTLARNGAIAAVIATVVAWRIGRVDAWPRAVVVLLWPTLGGHVVELAFLRGVRPRVRGAAAFGARVALWFAAGVALGAGARATGAAVGGLGPMRWLGWWVGGAMLVAIELIAHGVLRARGRPSCFDGRG